jgi:ribose transport system ATP-binding protein
MLNRRKAQTISDDAIQLLNIRVPHAQVRAGGLSGGNQQKLLISRWVAIGPRILILDEPTRGVDVGAKSEIYRIMNDMARQGVAILMISSELPEVVGMSDRVYVMREGLSPASCRPAISARKDHDAGHRRERFSP